MISVLLPSRERRDLLVRSIESLVTLASDMANVEVLVAYDPDDRFTAETADNLRYFEDWPVHNYEAPERYGYHRLHEYFNMLWPQAQGDWFLLWNDDGIMLTEKWDRELDDVPPGVASVHSNHDPFNVFPLVHRVVVEAMGHFSLSPHNDTWLWDVAMGAECQYDTPIQAIHDRFDLTGNNNDQIFRDRQYKTLDYYNGEMAALRALDIVNVRHALGKYHQGVSQ